MKSSGKAWLLGLVMTAGAVLAPAIASAGVSVGIEVAPPPIRVEPIPDPRPGYVWASGYWAWRDHAHVWIPGRWVGVRRGYHWVPDHWVQRGTYWHHVHGHWAR